MRICVYGAGAIGGFLAGRFAQSGAETSIVVRGAHLAAIRADGLRVETPGENFVTHPAASDDPATLGEQDAILVTVKAPSLPSVAAGLKPLMGPRTQVAFITNGIPWWYFRGRGEHRIKRLDPDGALWDAVPPAQMLGGIAWPASSVPAPGVIRMMSGLTRGTVLGTAEGPVTPALEALADAFKAANLPIAVSEQIRDVVWEKLAFNLSAGPMCVLTQSPVRATHEEPACIDASRRVLAEAAALIAAMGCHVALNVEQIVAMNMQLGHRPSVLQDLIAGRPMEIDALYTVPLEMARDAGVAMPTMELLAALIRVRAREAGLYAG